MRAIETRFTRRAIALVLAGFLQGCAGTCSHMLKTPEYRNAVSYGGHGAVAASTSMDKCWSSFGPEPLANAKSHAISMCARESRKASDCYLYAIDFDLTPQGASQENKSTAMLEAVTAVSSGVTAGLGGTPIAPQYRHLAPAPTPSYETPSPAKVSKDYQPTTRASQLTTCDGYPLQTIGDGPAGTVCRCSYGPFREVGWWAVVPGQWENASAPVRCSAPGTGAYAQTPSLPATPAQPSWPAQPQQPQVASPPQQQGSPSVAQQRQPSPAAAPRPQQPQYRPAYTHQDAIEREWSGSRQVAYYRVKVTNTGDVRLLCRASATGRVTYADGGSCIGVSALDCTNGRTRTVTGSSGVYPGRTVNVVSLGDFLRDGQYRVDCEVDPG